uniref:Uncharacterized protein n=1 Tax=Mesocestoides corti TaxID=53468 RepID=A0A5K3EMS9_MESCO
MPGPAHPTPAATRLVCPSPPPSPGAQRQPTCGRDIHRVCASTRRVSILWAAINASSTNTINRTTGPGLPRLRGLAGEQDVLGIAVTRSQS